MITQPPNLNIPSARIMLIPYGKARLPSVIKNILDKVECAPRFEPFIVKVLHFWGTLQYYVFIPKNSRVERYVPKEGDLRGGLRKRTIN